MISNEECMPLVLKLFPDFEKAWSEHLAFWGGDESGLGNDVAAFAQYTEELIAKSDERVESIFDFVETCLLTGSEQVKAAFTTCFLENLLNAENRIDIQGFAPFLGDESRKFCRAWNDFCGVRVPGI